MEGDLVVVALPGAVLPGGFEIASRSTYGRVSDGMIASERELGLGDDHAGIIVLPAGSAAPGDSGYQVLGLGDEVLDIAVTPDRGYALSIRGIAREVATAYDLPFLDPAAVDPEGLLPAPSGEPARLLRSPTPPRLTGSCCAPWLGWIPPRRARSGCAVPWWRAGCARSPWPSTSPTT